MSARRRTVLAFARPIGSALPAMLIAILPKCPACLGAYLAIASGLGLGKLSPGVLWGVSLVAITLALVLLGRAASRRRRWDAFAVACLGAAIVVSGRVLDAGRAVLIVGIVTLYAGSLRIYLSRLTRSMGHPACAKGGVRCHSK